MNNKMYFRFSHIKTEYLLLSIIIFAIVILSLIKVSIVISLLLFFGFQYFLFKSLWGIEFYDTEVLFRRKFIKKIIHLKYSEIEKIEIEKITSSYSYNTRLFIYSKIDKRINKLPFFHIYNTKKAFALLKFLQAQKKVENIKSNLHTFI